MRTDRGPESLLTSSFEPPTSYRKNSVAKAAITPTHDRRLRTGGYTVRMSFDWNPENATMPDIEERLRRTAEIEAKREAARTQPVADYTERNNQIRALRKAGMTLDAIGIEIGLSRESIRLILLPKRPKRR